MKPLAIAFVAGVALYGAASDSVAQSSRFKGWAAVSKELSTRIAPKGETLDLDRFLPAEDMEDLLGSWSTFGSEHAFQNGLPNSVNIAIWHATLSNFAKSIGASCSNPELEFHAKFARTLAMLCTWPDPSARTDQLMLDYWHSIMGYSAPEAEYLAWREHFLASYQSRPAAETITAMTLAITMNPYFLLHK